MSPLATYVYKLRPKSWRVVQITTKNVQKHIVGKLPDRYLSRKGQLARDRGIGGRGTSSGVFARCDTGSGLGGRNISDTDTSIDSSVTLTDTSSSSGRALMLYYSLLRPHEGRMNEVAIGVSESFCRSNTHENTVVPALRTQPSRLGSCKGFSKS
jgi:hypothetical protein